MTGVGSKGMAVGRRLKKASFSVESLTARFSKKAIVSTSLFFRTLDSTSLEGFRRREGAEASRRWYSCGAGGSVELPLLVWGRP